MHAGLAVNMVAMVTWPCRISVAAAAFANSTTAVAGTLQTGAHASLAGQIPVPHQGLQQYTQWNTIAARSTSAYGKQELGLLWNAHAVSIQKGALAAAAIPAACLCSTSTCNCLAYTDSTTSRQVCCCRSSFVEQLIEQLDPAILLHIPRLCPRLCAAAL